MTVRWLRSSGVLSFGVRRGLSSGVVCLILSFSVLVEHRLVTDRQTDRRTDMQTDTGP